MILVGVIKKYSVVPPCLTILGHVLAAKLTDSEDKFERKTMESMEQNDILNMYCWTIENTITICNQELCC